VGWTFYSSSGQRLSSKGKVPVSDLADGTDGELITWGTDAAPTTVAAGTSGYVLTSGGPNAVPSFQAVSGGASVKVGTFTRDTATASGNQAITGIGFTPKALLFMGGQSSSAEIGWGLSDGTNEQDLFDRHNVGANGYGIGNNRAMTFVEDGWKDYSATVASLDSANNGGFTLTWLRTGTPTGTLTIMYLAIG